MTMELQVKKASLAECRLVDEGSAEIASGEIKVKVDRFGFSANNVTYGVAGDTLGYWQFFPPKADDGTNWGIIPVWGFGDVIESHSPEIAVGERLFGYFPPAETLVLKPAKVSPASLMDASEHRSQLPSGYNFYRRIDAASGYDRANDNHFMLLYPLYITSFCLWDQMKEHDWYGAEQILLLSASSKTAIGLAFALASDKTAPAVIGMTSPSNTNFVEKVGHYDQVLTYDASDSLNREKPTLIVDMSGNASLLGSLHQSLGANMKHTLSVGLTHWEAERRSSLVIKDRTEFFFAPSRLQKRMKDWGPAGFEEKTGAFMKSAMKDSARWLELQTLSGLGDLQKIYPDVVAGSNAPDKGLIIEM